MNKQLTSESGNIPPLSVAEAIDGFKEIYQQKINERCTPVTIGLPVKPDSLFYPRQSNDQMAVIK